jgi:hypothetical protein
MLVLNHSPSVLLTKHFASLSSKKFCIHFHRHTILKLNNKILKYNRNPKLLGVTLDEKLNFGQHILNIEKKAGNSLIDVDSPFSSPFHNFIDVLLYTIRNFY